MPSPSFQSTPYESENLAVADVQEIIDDLDIALVAVGWLLIGPGVLRNPVNAAGQYVQITLTRIDADTLTVTFVDHLGRPGGAGLQLGKTGTQAFRYCYSTTYLVAFNEVTGEIFRVGVITYSPDPQNSNSGYVFFSGSTQVGGGGATTLEGGMAFNFQTNVYDSWAGQIRTMMATTEDNSGSSGLCQTPGGARRWFPMVTLGVDADADIHIRGRFPNVVILTGGQVSPGIRIPVPIDEATTAMMLVLPEVSSSPANARCAVRVPS